MSRWLSYAVVTAPACLVIATAVHFVARSADPQGCGWAHWATIVGAQLAIAAVVHPLAYAIWKRT